MRKSWVPVLATVVVVVGGVVPAMGQLVDRTQAPNAANEGIAKSLDQADRRRPRQLDDPGLLVLHHRPRPRPRDPPRPPALPAQVHARPGPGPARRRRRGRHRRATWPSAPASPTAAPPATAGRAARPASAATWSPVPTAATLRTCSASASRRCWPTRSRPTCARSASGAIADAHQRAPQRDAERCSSKGINYGSSSPRARRHRRHVGGAGRRPRPARAAVLRPRRDDLHARVPGRRLPGRDGPAGRRPRPRGRRPAGGARWSTPSGMVLDGRRTTIEAPAQRRSRGDDPDGDGVRQRGPDQHRRLHGVLPAQLLQAGARASRRPSAQRGRDGVPGHRLRTSATCRT